MSIKEIINTHPNIQLVISAADLKEFALELLAEREKSSNKSDKLLGHLYYISHNYNIHMV